MGDSSSGEEDDDYDEDEEEEEDGAPKRKGNSEELLKILQEVRGEMVKDNAKYEDSYYTEKLTPDDDKLMKLYLMTIGVPGKASVHPVKKKVLTAYIGASVAPTYNRIHVHNNIGITHRNPRTKTGASRWTLCMVLFIPRVLREKVSSKIIKRYWEAAHGRGKIKRGLLLQRMFGLVCYVPDDAKKVVSEQMPPAKLLTFDKYNFKTPTAANSINRPLSLYL